MISPDFPTFLALRLGRSTQGRLSSDWLICYPGTQTLFERALPSFMLTLLYCCTIAVMSYVADMSSDVMWNTQPIISCILSNNTQLKTGN